jgi:hypothetical protein
VINREFSESRATLFRERIVYAGVISILILFMSPDKAIAFQSHPEPEGLYVHQLAHVFFIIGMAIFAYWLQQNQLTRTKGWRLIQIACVLLILWNIVAIVGHFVEELVPRRNLTGEPDWTQRIMLGSGPLIPLYYVLKLDHLVSVPAIILLYLGMRKLYEKALKDDGRSRG